MTEDHLRELRNNTPEALQAARGIVIGIGMAGGLWAVGVLSYFWLFG